MSKNPADPTPDRPRDLIDFVEDMCGQKGSVAEVGPEYYESFLALNDAEIEVLAHAVLNAQAKEARRLTFVEPISEARARLIRFASNTIGCIGMGIERISAFAQIGLYKRVGPEPEPDVHDAMMQKIADARPIIERAVSDFIRQYHEATAESVSPEAPSPSATPIPDGWHTDADLAVESARIWQLQLPLFPPTSREVCGRIGLNWLTACHLHTNGWLSFEPRKTATLNEAQEAELTLVGSFVAAGCDEELLARILHGLLRPYQYRPGSIYLDWANACWRLLPVPEEPDPLQVFADWLDTLKEEEGREQLEDIARDVAAALKSLPEPEPGTPGG